MIHMYRGGLRELAQKGRQAGTGPPSLRQVVQGEQCILEEDA